MNHRRYYVRGFAWAWTVLRARNPSPRGLATLTPQSTCHGPRSGPKLARGVRAGSLSATETRVREKNRGRKRKKCRSAKYIFNISFSICPIAAARDYVFSRFLYLNSLERKLQHRLSIVIGFGTGPHGYKAYSGGL